MMKIIEILAVLGAISCIGFLWIAYVIISDVVRDCLKKNSSDYCDNDDMEDYYD